MSSRSSAELFKRAQELLPGGVNSPVRAFKGVGGTPVFFQSGSGSRMRSVEGKEYLDYVGSWGPLILGHTHPRVVEAIEAAARSGTSFGAPAPAEVALAERICGSLPSVEMLRMVNSGTEATMSAIRLARGFTGRDKILKFAGCYHGHSDSLLVKAGSGAQTLGVPDSAGVSRDVAANTLTVEYNDLENFKSVMEREGAKIACVIVEPVAGNMGVVPPSESFLQELRSECSRHGALLIFDEVMTGYRVAWGGAQLRYGIRPDITTLGKVIGGGLPVGAYGAGKELMGWIAPNGPVYQAGTLSGNPLAMAAGIATLDVLKEPGVYDRLEAISARLADGLAAGAKAQGIPVRVQRVGSMLTLFFSSFAVKNLQGAKQSDGKAFSRYFHAMLEQGVYLPPSAYEAWFVSLAHSEEDVDRTLAAHAVALKKVSEAA
ncbi:MAG: glutamate-1-semialdehyde 2,1-aminomutase [Candidatus Wallbacteria bacterium]|nr:glutamate-1-semialdehyde 2,1-aminomutase [Candidatus Wallbacteria bacterium]